jgi:hypothetical protein
VQAKADKTISHNNHRKASRITLVKQECMDSACQSIGPPQQCFRFRHVHRAGIMMTSSQDLLFHCAEKGTQPVGPRPVETMATIASISYLRVKVVQKGHIANMIDQDSQRCPRSGVGQTTGRLSGSTVAPSLSSPSWASSNMSRVPRPGGTYANIPAILSFCQ